MPKPTKRTKMSLDLLGRVTLEYTDFWGERISRTFTCPVKGGYVLELIDNGTKQPCERLGNSGNTLRCDSIDALPDLIRHEYHRMRLAERGTTRS